MKVLITGAAGLLGQAIVRHFGGCEELQSFARRELDITDARTVRATILRARPDVVINCAGYNNVDEAEDQQVLALEVNAFAVRTLAWAAADAGAALVHYSSDFVFDGTGSVPYTEDDPPNPQGVYATSKLLGEWFARDAGRHYVVRVESLFGGDAALRRSSLDWIVSGILEGRDVRVFVDRTVSPSYVEDVAAATRALVTRQPPAGLYHCVNSGVATWFEIAREAARLLGRDARLVPVAMASARLRAPRPLFCAMSNAKLTSAGVSMPPWQDALARYLTARELKAER